MIPRDSAQQSKRGSCLQDEDFYSYVTRSDGTRPPDDIESHLAECSICRKELAELIQILHPEPADVAGYCPNAV